MTWKQSSAAFTTLSSLNQPLTFGLLFFFFLTIWLGKKNFRPGLTITKRRCPSLFIMPIWTIVVLFTFVALFTLPDTTGPDYTKSEEICKQDQADDTVKEICNTRSLHIAYAGSVMAMAPFFLIAHLIMTYFRLGKGITIAKWPALVICETSKAVTAFLFLLGAQSFVDSGETTQSSPFFVSMAIVFAALMTISLGRIVALITVGRTAEGLSSTNFNSTYFGTDAKCPFASWECCCETKPLEEQKPKELVEEQPNPL